MNIKATLQALDHYTKTKDTKYRAERYEIAADALSIAEQLSDHHWAELYSAVMTFLWQQHTDFLADQPNIHNLLIKPSLSRFTPDPLPGGPNVAWLLNNANFGAYAPAKNVHGFLTAMRPCFVYIIRNEPSAQWIADVQRYGHTVRIISGTADEKVAGVREWCRKDGIGCLISDLYQSAQLWTFATRSAPVQMYLSPGFQMFPADVVLLTRLQQPIVSGYEWVSSPLHRDVLTRPAEAMRRPGRVVFGTMTRMEKCSPEYLAAVTRVLDAVPGAVFMACGRGRIQTEDKRFYQPGVVHPAAALGAIDVYLDTFPTCGGISVAEAMAHGVPVVTLDHPSVTTWNRCKPVVVNGVGDYVSAAVDALGERRAEFVRAGYVKLEEWTDCEGAARELEEIIDRRMNTPLRAIA